MHRSGRLFVTADVLDDPVATRLGHVVVTALPLSLNIATLQSKQSVETLRRSKSRGMLHLSPDEVQVAPRIAINP